MSLYYEAEHVNSSSKQDAGGKKNPQKLKSGLIYGACFLVPLIVGFCLVRHQADAKAEVLADKEKVRLIKTLRNKTTALTENGATAAAYPFIGESKVHEYRIKYVSSLGSKNGNRNSLDDSFSRGDNNTSLAGGVQNSATNTSLDTNSLARDKGTSVTTRKQSVEELFNQAVNETGGRPVPVVEGREKPQTTTDKGLWDLPATTRRQVPSFVYSAHNYSSDPYKRSVVINGKTLREGGEIGRLQVKKITPNSTVFSVGGVEFSQRALDDYQAQ